MALSNAERQKRYREQRKNNTSELEALRNEFKSYVASVEKQIEIGNKAQQHAQDLFWQIEKLREDNKKLRNENDQLRAENEKLRALRKKSRKQIELLDQNNAFFYVENGVLHLLQWPETPGTLKTRGIEIFHYSKGDKKYKKQFDALISEFNTQAEKLNLEST
jgi:hypothetical protein